MEFKIEWFDKLASTNTTARELFLTHTALPSGTIIAAREQTAGRGRHDRKWLTAPHSNLCFSLLICTEAELTAIPSLTMAAALAVNDLLHSMGVRSSLKWPNDVLVGERKICGILSERIESRGLIIGVGLNVNMSVEEARAIDRPASSILIETGETTDVAPLLVALLPHLAYWINAWKKDQFSSLREAWTLQAGPLGKPLTVRDGDLKKSGTLAGFGDHGELLLNTAAGIETIWSGDVC